VVGPCQKDAKGENNKTNYGMVTRGEGKKRKSKKKPDIIDIIEKKRLQWYGHVKRMPKERIPKLIME
jgi:hypothetical protein